MPVNPFTSFGQELLTIPANLPILYRYALVQGLCIYHKSNLYHNPHSGPTEKAAGTVTYRILRLGRYKGGLQQGHLCRPPGAASTFPFAAGGQNPLNIEIHIKGRNQQPPVGTAFSLHQRKCG